MSVFGSVTDLQNSTAINSVKSERKPGGDMGKHDFLMLLSAQLRFQDPLNPQSDSDFAAGLAQFSSLEQMQNMNSSLESMTSMQSYGLIGKYVIADADINGVRTEIPGVVDSIFTSNGILMAQIGEYIVPVTSIREVFNTDNILTSEMLLTASNNLIGRTIIAELNGKDIEGTVTRVFVDKGQLIAQIDDGTKEPKFVPVNAIVDIREVGTKALAPKPDKPPEAKNFKPDGEGGFIEVCEKNETELGLWTWNEDEWKWIYTSFEKAEEPKNEEPGTGEEPGDELGEEQAA